MRWLVRALADLLRLQGASNFRDLSPAGLVENRQ
jgi:hypothetical protein